MTTFIYIMIALNLLAIAAAGRRYTVKTRRENEFWAWHEAECAFNRKLLGIQSFDNSASTIQISAANPNTITAATIQNMGVSHAS